MNPNIPPNSPNSPQGTANSPSSPGNTGEELLNIVDSETALREFIKKIDVPFLKNIFSNLPQNPEQKNEAFFIRLEIVVECLKNLIQLLKNTPYHHFINHDIQQVTMLGSILESRAYIKDISDYLPDVESHTRLLCAFIESLYFVLDIPQDFIRSKKRNFSIQGAIEILEKTGLGEIPGSKNIGKDIQYYGIEGDMIILLGNIMRNAKKHGKAQNVVVSIEEKDGIKLLVIQDDGVGIPEEILGDIFQSGISGAGSSGIGLRDMEKRGILIQAANTGLVSKQNTQKRGARFEIEIR